MAEARRHHHSRNPRPSVGQGLITRITPHWFHVFYYRHVLGIKTAGKIGHGPYRAYFDRVVSRPGIREFCNVNGLVVDANTPSRPTARVTEAKRAFVGAITRFIGVLSFGTFSDRHADLLYVLRRKS